jgi:uncharacterized membrane protein YgcG
MDHERSLIRKQLTPAQVKKAYKDGLYTRQQAVDALLARGYDQADADTLLDEYSSRDTRRAGGVHSRRERRR